jgi:hypothetical protein
MDASKKSSGILAAVALCAVLGAAWLVGPDRIQGFFKALYDSEELKKTIAWGGYTLLAVIVFAETGLLVGFFLPGDSLLVASGVLSAQGLLDIVWLKVLLIPVGILGDSVNYSLGRRTARPSSARTACSSRRRTSCAPSASTRRTAARRSSWRASSPSCGPSRPSPPAWPGWPTSASRSSTSWAPPRGSSA